MRIITINTNGIRAAARKGFFDWLKKQQADVICIQETKAQLHQLDDPVFHPKGYHRYFHDAQKKGYSGVAIYCRQQPKKIIQGIGWYDVDQEGRFIEVQFDKLSVISLYMHSGSSSEARQAIKFDFMERFMLYLQKLRRKRREYIICGDWNIAHKNIDIKNWRSNQQNSGFLPEERAWLDRLYDEIGYVDAFRVINQQPHQYTWWSNRGQAWANNTGWRIDYQIITPKLKDLVETASIYKDERFSDHAPLIIDYAYTI
jgi:exodeoxyribonuclease-3